MQPDAEHQQDHPDLGQLARKPGIGHKTRRDRPHQNPGQQIAHQRRQLQAIGKIAKDRREPETDGNGGNEGDVVMHACVFSFWEPAL